MKTLFRCLALCFLASCNPTSPTLEDGGEPLEPPVPQGCRQDADCGASPAACAVVKCNAGNGRCELFARDQDGDGERAKNCDVAGAGAITLGADCDDTDALVHPGAAEQCDALNVDENCNGTSNEGCGCPVPGAMNVCCSGRGTQTCEADGGTSALSSCSASIGNEVCNALDDDCDGIVDEAVTFGELDGGSLQLDAGFFTADGTCIVGIGACRTTGSARCVNGDVSCDASPRDAGVETCNTIDDDCNGLVDDAVVFAAAPVDGGVINANGTCDVGVGACRRSGYAQCVNGEASCDVTPRDPQTESCNAIDDDCDGQTDDGANLCGTDGQFCSNGACTCSAGQSVCGTGCAVLGGSCSVGVGACARTGTFICGASGARQCSVVAGIPGTEVCDNIDNNCNGQVDEGTRRTCYADPDGDGFASNSTPVSLCGTTCPAGYTTSPGNDCLPNDRNAYRVVTTSIDVDGDSHCLAGSQQARCIGASIPTGQRQSCTDHTDCNDNPGFGGVYQTVSLRIDADSDFSCVGAAFNSCIGATAPPATRLATECRSEDCKDDNGQVSTVCSYPGHRTSTATKSCGIGPPPSETINVFASTTCSAGYHLANLGAARVSSGGACTPASPTSIHMGCNGITFGQVQCYLYADCIAD